MKRILIAAKRNQYTLFPKSNATSTVTHPILPRSISASSKNYLRFFTSSTINPSSANKSDEGGTINNDDEHEEERVNEYLQEEIETEGEWAGCSRSFMAPIRISVRGSDILYNPLFNKGTAFKTGERDRLRFRGLLPPRITNMHVQIERFLKSLREEDSPIRKNIMLEDLHDRNETLYHRIIVDHVEEVAPLIYTPTVGQACKEFGTRYRRQRGMYFTEVSYIHNLFQ